MPLKKSSADLVAEARARIEEVETSDMIAMVERYSEQGADGVILGCTELCMILSEGDGSVPIFSTTHIHAAAIAFIQRLCQWGQGGHDAIATIRKGSRRRRLLFGRTAAGCVGSTVVVRICGCS